MKILYAVERVNLRGGYDRIIIEKANYLAEHGCEVIICVSSHTLSKPFYPISEKVKLVDFDIDFDQQYKHSLFIRAYIYKKLMRHYRKMLSNLLNIEHPDIVITTLGREIDFITEIDDGSVKVGESHIAKEYVRNFHLLEQRGFIYRLLACYWRKKVDKAAGKLDALVLLTQQDADAWAGIAKTIVIPNSLPFYPSTSSTCDNKQAIFVGRFNEQKGLEYLVDTWAKVYCRHPDWTLHLYGDGEQKNMLEHLVNDAKLQDVVIIHQPTPQIMDRYLESSIFVLTSRFEGFGMVLIEAMACGLPVVSFNCPWGPADIIKNEEDGFLVEYLNTDEEAERICQLIENPLLRKTMGTNARKNIKRYERDNVMKQWTELFEKLRN